MRRGQPFERKRYIIEARRKRPKSPWTDWNSTDDYEFALKQKERVEALGHEARIIDQGEFICQTL